MDEEKKDLEKRLEGFGFALCGIIGNLYEWLSALLDYDITGNMVPRQVARAYIEAVDAMLDEGTTTIRCGDVPYNMDDLEDFADRLKALR